MYFKTSDWSDETLQDKCSEFAKKIQPNQSENPKVSVYFCAHNEEDYLLPTLHSYAQIHSKIPYEII